MLDREYSKSLFCGLAGQDGCLRDCISLCNNTLQLVYKLLVKRYSVDPMTSSAMSLSLFYSISTCQFALISSTFFNRSSLPFLVFTTTVAM